MVSKLNYLDYAAATPVDRRVLEAMLPYFSDSFYNPSSPYAPAVQVRRDYSEAKNRIAATFGAKGDEIIITAGATESINLAFSGIKGHVVTSSIEHPAVLAVAKLHDHTIVEVTEHGIVTPEAVRQAIRDDTQLVSIQLANNEIGTVQPLRDIATLIRQEQQKRASSGNTLPLYFHCDASQGFGQIDVHIARLGVDMLTLNSGKMYGPKQVGLLWVKPGVLVQPLIVGGGQEKGMRSGTENVAGVIGFAAAAEFSAAHRKSEAERLMQLRNSLEKNLLDEFPDAVISGHPKKRLPGVLHISFPGLDAERMVFLLEAEGVMVATGSACAANKGTRSHVLTAIGLAPEVADGSVRLSLGRATSETTIKDATKAIIVAAKSEYKRTEHNG